MADTKDDHMSEVEAVASTDDIKELLASNRTAIDKLKALVAEHIPEGGTDGVYCAYDDIFFLRYILSFTTPAKAKDSVIKTIQYRALPENQALFREIKAKNGAITDDPVALRIRKYQCGVMLPPEAQVKEGATVLVRGSFTNNDGLFANITYEEQVHVNMLYREISFWQCNRATRAKGKLAKQVLLFDMSGVKFSDMMDKRQSEIHSKVTALAASYYPQLLQKMCMVNAPSWMTWVLSLSRKVLPKRNMDKIEMFTSHDVMWQSDWAKATLNPAYIPTFLGGKQPEGEMHPDLTGKHITDHEEDHWHQLTVAAQSQHKHTLDIPFAGIKVNYSVVMSGYGINVSATLKPLDSKADSKAVPILAEKKVKADAGLCTGVMEIPHAGTLSLRFDNSYSWVRSKTLKFQCKIDESSAVAVEKANHKS